MLTEINDELQYLCSLKFAKNEIDYLRRFSYFDDAYLSFLSRFQLKMSQCNVYLSEDKELKIEINGSWIETIFFEIPIL
jgi:nicotinate phosphoribosyltransferase